MSDFISLQRFYAERDLQRLYEERYWFHLVNTLAREAAEEAIAASRDDDNPSPDLQPSDVDDAVEKVLWDLAGHGVLTRITGIDGEILWELSPAQRAAGSRKDAR